ncbi:transporter substrate-binding domain-containing protein [Paracoccus denitrificans]|uniref:transporter substrate-binding domain-containing protein n=1 Tax=Paracoccus denitrificans TaxID=266 RepID=UPI001E4AF770|nr:transporter substrate-binding domain-containing protein [Paracoccus denitrificans]UFS67180.1 transporter substrate-binding domain-containing protein [Paracoccus denitrificans]
MKTSHRVIAFCILFLASLCLQSPASSQEPQPQPLLAEPLQIGVFVNPPFVMRQGDKFTGMAVDLWERLGERLDRQYHYVEFQTLGDLLDATASGKVDVAVTNTTINRSRAERLDFTQPWFDGGMRIMINTDQSDGFGNLLAGLSKAGYLRSYAWMAMIVVAATVLLTLFDRRFDASFPKRWTDGIAESFYTVMSVATSGKPPARSNLFGWVGRIWQGVWLACGVAVLAYVTSSITSVMTTLSLTNQINSIADVADRPIGVLTGTVEEEFVRAQGIQMFRYPSLEDAVDGLRSGETTAIVADAPILEYYAHSHPDQPVKVVGRLFEPDKYGFALPRLSRLTRPITVALLGAIDSGEVEALRKQYFGR